jgi:hypothetical protein
MTLGLPGAQGLFSTLQECFHHPVERHRLRLTAPAHAFLSDFKVLAAAAATRPTRINELLPQDPSTLGCTDAAAPGMGGVVFVPRPDGSLQPFLWRSRFEDTIINRLVSSSNRSGDITNSDLELAGSVAQHDVIAQHFDTRGHTLHNFHDNTAAVWWQRKGSTTTTKAADYLLRLQSLHQRHHGYVPTQDYLPGPSNSMADDCSRLWHLSDSALLSHFNLHYPQKHCWQSCSLRTEMHYAIHSALCSNISLPESFLHENAHRRTIGPAGKHFVNSTPSIRSYSNSKTPFRCFKSLPPVTELAKLHPVATPSALTQWKTPYVRWARGSPVWGPRISGK